MWFLIRGELELNCMIQLLKFVWFVNAMFPLGMFGKLNTHNAFELETVTKLQHYMHTKNHFPELCTLIKQVFQAKPSKFWKASGRCEGL